MSDITNSKCPYCGAGLLQEEDGYRCKLCKSFFQFEKEQDLSKQETGDLSRISMIQPRAPKHAEETEFARNRSRNELIGMATAFISAVFMVFCRLYRIPLLMIPGFAFWAFAAGFTGYQVHKAFNAGHRMLYIRVFLLLLVAILMLFFINPVK